MANTGAPIGDLLTIGGLLAGAGGLLQVLGRRRPNRSH